MKIMMKKSYVGAVRDVIYATGWTYRGGGWFECHGTGSDLWTAQNGLLFAGRRGKIDFYYQAL